MPPLRRYASAMAPNLLAVLILPAVDCWPNVHDSFAFKTGNWHVPHDVLMQFQNGQTKTSTRTRFIGRSALIGLVLAGELLGCTGCSSLKLEPDKRLRPSNTRDWTPEQAALPFAEINGSHYVLRNIRDCNYLTNEDFVVNYSDRAIDLSQVQSVDFIVVPFKPKSALAHTMLSFGLDDGSYLGMSVEVRKEKKETYHPVSGVLNKYELMYVLGDERDLIRLRTKYYDSEVYVFPTVATPAQAQRLFADMTGRMNGLVTRPEFYHSITNNCTTNLKDHVNQISPQKIRENAWQVLLPGFSAEYAHEIGLVENRIPYPDLERIAYVNELVNENFEAPNFSQAIRSNRYLIDREIARQKLRQPISESRGAEYLARQPRLNREREPFWR